MKSRDTICRWQILIRKTIIYVILVVKKLIVHYKNLALKQGRVCDNLRIIKEHEFPTKLLEKTHETCMVINLHLVIFSTMIF